ALREALRLLVARRVLGERRVEARVADEPAGPAEAEAHLAAWEVARFGGIRQEQAAVRGHAVLGVEHLEAPARARRALHIIDHPSPPRLERVRVVLAQVSTLGAGTGTMK